MVKTPKMRRPSQPARDPMTIDAEAEAALPVSGAPETETGPAADWRRAEDDGFAATAGDPAPFAPDAPPEEIRATEAFPDDSAMPASSLPDPLAPHANDLDEPRDFDGSSMSSPSARYPGPTPVPPPRPARGASLLGAGVVGGIVALAGATALQLGGWLPSPGGSAPAGIQDVRTEVLALRQDVAALQGSSGAAADAAARVGELSTSLDQVKADIANRPAGAAAPASPNGDPALGPLADRLAALESTVQGLGTPRPQPPSADLTALGERLASVEALAKTASQNSGAGENKLAALDQSLAALGQSIAALEQKVESQASQPKVAMSIAASGLKAALDRGGAFESELEAFAAIAPEAPELASLRSLAAKGVATVDELQAQARGAVDTMLAADRPTAQNAGFFDRLLSSAENIVTVRPVGPVEGAGAPETAARMEDALNRGDLAKALAEYDTMPEPAKSAGASFAQKIRDRLEAERLADVLIAGAMKAA